MDDKTVLLSSVFIVLIVGALCLVGLSSSGAGDAVLGRRQCCCEVDHYDVYGNKIPGQVFPAVRVKNTENCDVYCHAHFGNLKYRDVVSSVAC